MNSQLARQLEQKYRIFVEMWCSSQSRQEVIDKLTNEHNWRFVGSWRWGYWKDTPPSGEDHHEAAQKAKDQSIQSLKKRLQHKGVPLKELPKWRAQAPPANPSRKINYALIAEYAGKLYKNRKQQ